MSFGIGFRHRHYAELLENPTAFKPQLDFLEVHSENFFGASLPAGGAARAVLQQARQHFPISLHGVGLSLGSGSGSANGLDPWHLDQLADLVQRTEPLLVSDHACFARGSLPSQGELHAADLLPIPFSREALAVLVRNVQQVQERLGRRIAVENLSAYFAWQDADYTEPEFLNALAQHSGCQLLIDVNNLFVNALNEQTAAGLARDPAAAARSAVAWLQGISPQHVVELHLAGHCELEDLVIDDHSRQVCEPVWQVYRAAKARFTMVHTLVEWDTEVPELGVLLGEVARARLEAVEAVEVRGAVSVVANTANSVNITNNQVTA